MHPRRIIASLDIGTSEVKLVIATITNNRLIEIVGADSIASNGIYGGIINNIDKVAEAIGILIRNLEENLSININLIKVGLADKSVLLEHHSGILTRKNQDDEINVDDVRALQLDMYRTPLLTGNHIVHVIPNYYTIDYIKGVKDPVGITGTKIEGDFSLITISSTSIKNVQKCLSKINKDIESVNISPLASALVVLTKEEREAGVCLVDLGSETIDISIFFESMLQHLCVLPFGFDIINSDIKYAFGVLNQQAEKLKIQFGSAMLESSRANDVIEIPNINNRAYKLIPFKALTTVIEARVTEIAQYIYKEITKVNMNDKLSAGIVLIGGGSRLNLICELFEETINIETRIGFVGEDVIYNSQEIDNIDKYIHSIGMIKSSIESIDYREDYYRKKHVAKNSTETPKKENKPENSSVLKKIWNKTKNMLIDDYNE
jgi:cell division protein FtsA